MTHQLLPADRFITADVLDGLRSLDSESVQCCVTSPPYYGLRDYGEEGQIGLEKTPEEYTARLVEVFAEVRRVLRDDGVVWLNLGDSYAATAGTRTFGDSKTFKGPSLTGTSQFVRDPNNAARIPPPGLKPKDLVGIPWRVAFALQADGWWLRSDVIWSKPSCMPESVTDRPTCAHEHVFLLSKSERYFYDIDAIREPHTMTPQRRPKGRPVDEIPRSGQPKQSWPTAARDDIGVDGHPLGRNKRSVWTIATQPFAGAHFATMPPELAETCVKAGSRIGDVVLDPFGGAGTTALCARLLGRRFVHIDLNPAYIEIARRRVDGESFQPSLFAAAR